MKGRGKRMKGKKSFSIISLWKKEKKTENCVGKNNIGKNEAQNKGKMKTHWSWNIMKQIYLEI